MATQLGTEKKVASTGAKITVPGMESFVIGEEAWDKTVVADKYNLKHTPLTVTVEINGVPTQVSTVKEIYALNGDSTFGMKYVVGTAASETEFTIKDNVITLPTKLAKGTELFVMYEYESDQAVEVVNSAKNFPVGCKFIMEVLGCDVCDQTNLIYAYLVFPNFKLSPDFDWSVATDGAHPFSGRAQQDYCDREKKLFSVIIPGDE